MREIYFSQALNEALREEMSRDDRIFLIGEDIGIHGGAFGVTKGLMKEFGSNRVRCTPVSEAAICGTMVGSALLGFKPVAEIMYIDFITIAMDQIINQAAKMRYMTGGQASVPAVVRTQGGAGNGEAAQHSQSLESWFCHIPGLYVIMPSTPYNAKGLLKASIRDPNPVIFIEHKCLYSFKGLIPEKDYIVPIGVADIKRKGKDITIIAYSRMVDFSLRAAEELANDGIDAEVIDLQTLKPLDKRTIFSSVIKTGYCVIVEEDCKMCGFGAELVALISESCFDHLNGPVLRVATKDVPIPYATNLETEALPNISEIIKIIKNLF